MISRLLVVGLCAVGVAVAQGMDGDMAGLDVMDPEHPGHPDHHAHQPVQLRHFPVHAFTYHWYGDASSPGSPYKHWNHEVLPHWNERLRPKYPFDVSWNPPDDPHCPYMPLRGLYSSADETILRAQFREMAEAGISVAVMSWWGRPDHPHTHDTQGVNTDDIVPAVLKAAAATNMHVAFHLEPYHGRTAETVKDDVKYIIDKYGDLPGVLKIRRMKPDAGDDLVPLFYLYDSQHRTAAEWATIFDPKGSDTIRGTKYDGFFFGLWVDSTSGRDLLSGGFDGAYTYFSSTGFTYGSTPENWNRIGSFLAANSMAFSVSVGPGYDDSRIRPWNSANVKERREGKHYDMMWEKAVAAHPNCVSITTYNEWGEGTQIEPAVPHTAKLPPKDGSSGMLPDVRLKLGPLESKDYTPHSPHYYMHRTHHWAMTFQASKMDHHPPSDSPTGRRHTEL